MKLPIPYLQQQLNETPITFRAWTRKYISPCIGCNYFSIPCCQFLCSKYLFLKEVHDGFLCANSWQIVHGGKETHWLLVTIKATSLWYLVYLQSLVNLHVTGRTHSIKMLSFSLVDVSFNPMMPCFIIGALLWIFSVFLTTGHFMEVLWQIYISMRYSQPLGNNRNILVWDPELMFGIYCQWDHLFWSYVEAAADRPSICDTFRGLHVFHNTPIGCRTK